MFVPRVIVVLTGLECRPWRLRTEFCTVKTALVSGRCGVLYVRGRERESGELCVCVCEGDRVECQSERERQRESGEL